MRCATLPHRSPCPPQPAGAVIQPRSIAVMGVERWAHRIGSCTTDTPLNWQVIPGDPTAAFINPQSIADAAAADLLLIVHSEPLSPVRVLPWMTFPRPVALTQVTASTVRCGPVVGSSSAGCLHCYALRTQSPPRNQQVSPSGCAGTAALIRGLWDSWFRGLYVGEAASVNPLTVTGLSVEVCVNKATMVTRKWRPHPGCSCTMPQSPP